MYEILVMPLATYWDELNDLEQDTAETVKELQEELTKHYEQKVTWNEPTDVDTEAINVSVVEDSELFALYALAAQLETADNIENFDLDPENPWDSDAFNELENKIYQKGEEITKYEHLLMPQNTPEIFYLPCDLPSVVSLQNDTESEEEPQQENADLENPDESGICVASLFALKKELDELQKVLKTDPSIDITDDETEVEFDESDTLSGAKIAWYILNAQLKHAIEEKLPLIIRYVEDEEYADILDELDDEDNENAKE